MAKDFSNILQLFQEMFGSKKQEALDLQSVFIKPKVSIFYLLDFFFPFSFFPQVINMAIPHYIL